jgi:hypothetical protein
MNCHGLGPYFRCGRPKSIASFSSESARESNFFVALVAQYDKRTGFPNCDRWHDVPEIVWNTAPVLRPQPSSTRSQAAIACQLVFSVAPVWAVSDVQELTQNRKTEPRIS